MSYPSIPFDNQTALSPEAGIAVDVADDGTIRGRVSFASTVYTATVVHSYITSLERDQIISFFDANKALSFPFTYDGDTYTMRFAAHPQARHQQGGWWTVTSRLVGTKD